MTELSYDFNLHKHNYATWTAARAVQRGWGIRTNNVKKAIEISALRQYSEGLLDHTFPDFDVFHKTCSQQIINSLVEQGIENASYGRAAKIISIYLKTTIILCNQGSCEKSEVIHPPIDDILLKSIIKKKGLSNLSGIRWTQLDESKYWTLVSELKKHFPNFNWKLEEYWLPVHS